jgi:NADH-quinone oxidoreductase subunit N
MAALSMLLGNMVALRQSSLRRLLAYSAIAHAGYMLLGIVAHTQQSLAALLYYVITYALATLGAFAVIAVVEEQKGSDELSNFDGLGKQSPVLSFSLAISILSLAGIPPLAGFFGKFYLFVAVLASTPKPADLVWLVVLAIAMSAVSLYYYLKVLKHVYVMPAPEGTATIQTPLLTKVMLLAIAAGVILLGCAPQLLLKWILAAASASGL